MDRGCIGGSQVHGDDSIIIIRLQEEDMRNGSHCKVCSPLFGPLLGSLKRERRTKKHSQTNSANPPHPLTHTEPLINYSHYINHIQKWNQCVCACVCVCVCETDLFVLVSIKKVEAGDRRGCVAKQ